MAGSGISRQEKQSRTRAALLDAASALFAERGYRNVSLDEIADRAGVTKGAVYSNFADKEELFAHVCLAHATTVETDAFADTTKTFEQQMRALGVAVANATLSTENAALATFELEMAQLALTSDRARAWVAKAFDHNRTELAALLHATAESGTQLPPLPVEELATILRATLHGLMQQRLADTNAVPPDYFEHAISLLLGNPDPRKPRTRRTRKPR